MLVYFSYKNEYPEKGYPWPERIRMPDGTTRTRRNEPYTTEELAIAGYKQVPYPPPFNSENQRLTWSYIGESLTGDDYGWLVVNISDAEKAQEVRLTRDKMIENVMWRVYRNQRELRLGLAVTEPISKLDDYIQALCDIPEQQGFPWNVAWPILED